MAGHEKRDEDQRLKQQDNTAEILKMLAEQNKELLEQNRELIKKLNEKND